MGDHDAQAVVAGKKLLDSTLYLASLASDADVIDPLLDTVRQVTARWTPDQPLGDTDRRRLEAVQSQLRNHLLHHDTVRHFTDETLDAQVDAYLASATADHRHRRTLQEVVVILLIVAAAFVIPAGFANGLSADKRLLIGATFGFGALYLGIAWLFWSGLQSFSTTLQRAYRYICIGYLITGVGIAMMPLGPAFPALTDVLLRYSVVMPIFIAGNLFIYAGTRIFALTLGIRSWATRQWRLYAVAAAVGLATIFLPHPTVEPVEWWFDATIASGLIMAALATGSTVLAHRISKSTTRMYARAMRWFSYTMALVAISSVAASFMILPQGKLEDFASSFVFYAIDGALMMFSAYLFKRSSGQT